MSNYAIVPLHPERRAVMQAIADVESRTQRARGNYPYARAFFRHLWGSNRITLREFRYFSPVLTARELRGEKDNWLRAIDMLIESRGACCYLPLPLNAGAVLFPDRAFCYQERQRRQDALRDEKYTRQHSKEENLRKRTSQSLAAQAEIALAFHTPSTVSSWLSRWSDSGIPEYELESMVMRWCRRFPSLSDWCNWPGEPLWRVVDDIVQTAKLASCTARSLDRWSVPNKLSYSNY